MLFTSPSPQTLPAPGEYPAYDTPGALPAPAPLSSIWRAWAAIARRPSSKVIAAWSEAGSTRWIWLSLAAVAVITCALGIVTNAIFLLAHVRFPITNASGVMTGESTYGVKELILAAVENPLNAVGRVTFVALALAIFLPQSYGSYGKRFLHALKPLALAYTVIQALAFLFIVSSAALTPVFDGAILAVARAGSTISQEQSITTPAGQAAWSVIQHNLPQILVWGALEGIAGIALLIFSLIVMLRAGRVASSLRGWAVFGIALLGLLAWWIPSGAIFGLVTFLTSR